MKAYSKLSGKLILIFTFCLLNLTGYTQCTSGDTYSSISVASCSVYTSPSGVQYTVRGTYNDTIPNAASCDSIITITLDVFYDVSITVSAFTCGEPYISGSGISYPSSGTYLENLSTINGCDSIVYIDVEIVIFGDTWITINACDQWTSDAGVVYTTSGTYHESFVANNGCDSVIMYTVIIDSVDNTANWIAAMTIEAQETGATYQWVDCNNNNAIIPGAIHQTYTAPVNGDFACIVSKGSCVKMTNCVRVESLGFNEGNITFGIYPNPSKGQFLIELNTLNSNTELEITSSTGQIVYEANLIDIKTNINLENLEVGVYFVSISNGVLITRKAIVIE
ncbi:MAG: T9SS type A sorting domain-containing protein [Crocinitomicaceae bacterium]